MDTQQINLTRFNLRFPEKRPFFLENSELFRVGKGNELDLFFSRRIGVDERTGSLIPIRGGARVSGKAAGFNVGVLNMQTAENGTTPANNFSVVRASRDFRSRSGVGAMFVNRDATGNLARSGDYNRTFGADARAGIGERITFSGFAARTQTPGLTGRDHAYNFDSEYDDGQHRATFEWGATGEDFNPEVGFLENEDGYRRFRVGFEETMRQQWIRDLGFREFLPHANYTRYDYLDGGLSSAELHADNHWDWENGNFITLAAQRHVGRAAPAVRGVSRHRGAGRRARRLARDVPRELRSAQVDLRAGAVGQGRISQRPRRAARRSRSSCATAGVLPSTRRGTIAPSSCRRARSIRTLATCA